MNTNNAVVAQFTDKYGETREIHNTRAGLRVRRREVTLCLKLNPVINAIVAKRVRALRKKRNLTLEELCLRAGIVSTTPKSRMWEIENNTRRNGIRFGTLFALAMALEVDPCELMPTIAEVQEECGIEMVERRVLSAVA